MLLATKHLRVLERLGAEDPSGYVADTDEAQSALRVLELEGLAVPAGGQSYQLTYIGGEALRLLQRMRDAGVPPPLNELSAGWRFLGSEMLAALAAAARAGGHVGPGTVELLERRGLAERSRRATGTPDGMLLTPFGTAWLNLARCSRPRIEITHDLAGTLLRLPSERYFTEHEERLPATHLAQLEAMELLAWTVPDGEVGLLTPLGRCVAAAVRAARYPASDAVLDDAILQVLARIARQGAAVLPDEELAALQIMGYLDSEQTVTVAGETALRAHALLDCWSCAQPNEDYPIPAFVLSRAEVEILAALRDLDHRGQAASKVILHTALVARFEQRYQDFVGEYGRTPADSIDTIARKRQAQQLQTTAHAHERAFADRAQLDRHLVHLQSFGLVDVQAYRGGAPAYRLSEMGNRVLDEQGDKPRDITAAAVKAVTALASDLARFQVPATAWVQQAHTERLLGPGGITEAGRLYAEVALAGPRLPFLSREEADALHHLPDHLPDQLPGHVPERAQAGAGVMPSTSRHQTTDARDQQWLVERLEACGLVEHLVDGQLVRTRQGEMLARAVSGASQLAYPVTPTLIKLIAALEQRSETLCTAEERPRAVAEHWDAVARAAGIAPEELQETLHLARLGAYLGDAGLTEAGKDLIAVFAHGEASTG